MQGQSPCPRSAERGTPLCLLKRRRGSKGEPSPGVPPFFFAACPAARSANENFARLFKGGGVQGRSPCPRSAERGNLFLCSHKRRRGGKGEPSPGVPPFLYVCACAPIRWEVVVALSCLSTPFLWCLPKETVSSRQRKAPFYPGGSTIRVSAPASVVVTHLRPTWGGGWWVDWGLKSA